MGSADSVGELNQRLCRAFEIKSERSDKPRGVSHSAGRQNSKSIGVDMVFYYGPAQSSQSFICAFKLFTFSFVNPVAWLRLASAGKACFFCDVWHCDKRLRAGNMALGTICDF